MVSARLFTSVSACSLAALTLPLHPAAAQSPAIGFTPDAFAAEDNAADAGAPGYTLGFEFTANSASRVTALGFFNDPSFDPATPLNTVALSPTPVGTYAYAQSHEVGLYQVLPNGRDLLLASATVTTASAPSGDFLYQSLTAPVTLAAGGEYVLAGVTGPTDPYIFNIEDNTQPGNVGLTVAPALTYVQDRFGVSTTLAFPTSTDPLSEPGFFGPNLLSSPVPEASTILSLALMLSLGLAGLGLAARRRSR